MKPSRYCRMEKIGEGSFGKVYKARDIENKKLVALKRVKIDYEEQGIPCTTVREVSILKGLHHDNIVKLLDVFLRKNELFLVFEYLEMDLKKCIDDFEEKDEKMSVDLVRNLMWQIISAIDFMHSRGIVHRDLKPQNILVNREDYLLKLCDYGLSRVFNIPVRPYSHEVMTLWYRAPEILLGCEKYGLTVDIWSVGCIFVELINLCPLFPGDSEIDELLKIFQVLGTPNEENWKGVTNLPFFNNCFPLWEGNWIGSQIKDFDKMGIDLVEKMLVFDPKKRISAKLALLHPFFDPIRKSMINKK